MNKSNKIQRWADWWLGGKQDEVVKEAMAGGVDDLLRLAVLLSRLFGSGDVEWLRERVRALSGGKT